VQIIYAIGVAEPISIMADFMSTGMVPERKIKKYIGNLGFTARSHHWIF
jgi:S-adenosylmethionine synthetase